MTEQSRPGQSPENALLHETKAVELLSGLPNNATEAEVQKLRRKIKGLPATVVRTGGAVEDDWVIDGISPGVNDQTGQRVVWMHQDKGKDDDTGFRKGIMLDELLSWQTPEGLARAVEMQTVDWSEVVAIEGPKGSMSVRDIEELREGQLSRHALGVKTPEEATLAREKRAQELVDTLLPVDEAPSDWHEAARYERQRHILREDLTIGEDGFWQHKRMWFDRYSDGKVSQPVNDVDDKLSAAERHEYREAVNALRHDYAERLAKRSRSMTEGVWTSAAITQAREELADVIGAEATQMYIDGSEKGIDKDILTEQIDAFVKEQTDMLLGDMQASRIANVAGHNRFVKWGIDKWAELGGPEQMHLSLKEKIKTKEFWIRTGVLGGIGALVGLPAGIAFGAAGGIVGAGALAAFGAGLLTRTIARNIATVKLDNAVGAATIAETQRQQYSTEINDKWDASLKAADYEDENRVSHADLLEYIDQQSELIRKASNKKLLGNIGVGLAFGLAFGAAGAGIHMLAPQMGEFFNSLHGKLGSRTGSGVEQPSGGATEPGSGGGKPPLPTVEQSPAKPPLPTVDQSPANPPLPTVDSDHMAPGTPPPDVLPEAHQPSSHGHEVRLWQGAATERVLERAYPGVKNPFARINELYDKLGKDGVFEVKNAQGKWIPVHLSEHDPNNIWIMRDSGTVRLTSDAQSYLDSLHTVEHVPNEGDITSDIPTVKAAESLIHSEELVPANTISNGESITRTLHELRGVGVVDVPASQEGRLVNEIGRAIYDHKSINHYSDGSPIVYKHRFPPYDWRWYKAPGDGRLPNKVIRLIEEVARGYKQAA